MISIRSITIAVVLPCISALCSKGTLTGNAYAIAYLPLINGTFFPENTTLEFFCKRNYSMSGSYTSVCRNGTWTNSAPICLENCPQPSLPANGSISSIETTVYPRDFDSYNTSLEDYRVSSNVTFKCDPDHMLSGPDTIICQTNGTWSSGPTCTEIDGCFDPSLLNGFIIPLAKKINGMYPENTHIYIGCNKGHILGTIYTTCTNGIWLPPPQCIAYCSEPPSPTHGRKSSVSKPNNNVGYYPISSNVTFRCNKGFLLNGQDTITCQTDGTWSPAPTCKPNNVTCPDPTPANGSLSHTFPPPYNGTTYLEGSVVIYNCDSGYNIIGSIYSFCKANKNWDPAPATCIAA